MDQELSPCCRSLEPLFDSIERLETRRRYLCYVKKKLNRDSTFVLDTNSIFSYPLLMDAQSAIDLFQGMIWTGMMIVMPILVAGTAIGLLIGLFQALTQIQEQTIAIVLKIIVMILVAAYMLPWMTEILIERSIDVYHTIPGVIPYD
jgi:flagellar biosynthetic protein FliQ